MIRALILLALFVLSSCAVPKGPSASRSAAGPLPPMKLFSTARPAQPSRSNALIAQDILNLSFALESGRDLRQFSRFESPIRIAFTGQIPPLTLERDLDNLVARLRTEAGLDIARSQEPNAANIRVHMIDKRTLKRVTPNAACFVVPGLHTFEGFLTASRTPAFDWTAVTQRTGATAFIPGDISPQEARDCLHEEVAQALGPLNDLFHLTDSTFNDDNFHTVLTGFDMLVLRALYAPEMRSGMSKARMASVLPRVLARINPEGNFAPRTPAMPLSQAWRDAVQTAMSNDITQSKRRASARRALELSDRAGWQDARYAYSHFLMGTLLMSENSALSLEHFKVADLAYARLPGTQVQRAHISLHLAAIALRQGDFERTIDITTQAASVATQTENAALLSMILMVRAEALRMEGRESEARSVRLDGFGWARYGFGSDELVQARWNDISRLAPK
ncbi:MAG: DUF2927 domain-containing protein [Pseudomonadota bacterium]